MNEKKEFISTSNHKTHPLPKNKINTLSDSKNKNKNIPHLTQKIKDKIKKEIDNKNNTSHVNHTKYYSINDYNKNLQEINSNDLSSSTYKKAISNTFLYMQKILPFSVYENITKNYRNELSKEISKMNSIQNSPRMEGGKNNQNNEYIYFIKNKHKSIYNDHGKKNNSISKTNINSKKENPLQSSKNSYFSGSVNNSSRNDSFNKTIKQNSNPHAKLIIHSKKHSLYNLTKEKLNRRTSSIKGLIKPNESPTISHKKNNNNNDSSGNNIHFFKKEKQLNKTKKCSRNEFNIESSLNFKNCLEQLKSKLKSSKLNTTRSKGNDLITYNMNKSPGKSNKKKTQMKKPIIRNKNKNNSVSLGHSKIESKIQNNNEGLNELKTKFSSVVTNLSCTASNTKRQKNENEEKSINENNSDISRDNIKNNAIQLKQIKSTLDDNLKYMFSFSYEDFLNKDSETEGKSIDETINHFFHNK